MYCIEMLYYVVHMNDNKLSFVPLSFCFLSRVLISVYLCYHIQCELKCLEGQALQCYSVFSLWHGDTLNSSANFHPRCPMIAIKSPKQLAFCPTCLLRLCSFSACMLFLGGGRGEGRGPVIRDGLFTAVLTSAWHTTITWKVQYNILWWIMRPAQPLLFESVVTVALTSSFSLSFFLASSIPTGNIT